MSTGDPQKRSLTSQMLDTAMASVAFMVLTFVSGVLISRLLGPEGRGIYGTVHFWAQLGFGLLSFSVFDAAVIKLRKSEKAPEKALPSVLLLAVGALFCYCVVASVGVAFGLIKVGNIGATTFVWASGLLAAVGLSVRAFTVVESVNLDFRRMNVERIVSPALFAIFVGLMLVTDVADPLVTLLVFVAASVPLIVWRIIRFRRNLVGKIDRPLLVGSVKLGGRLHIATGAIALSREIDRIVLVAIWPTQWMGYYFVAFSAASAGVSLIMQSLNITLLPTLSGLDAGVRNVRLERLMRVGVFLVPVTVVPIWLAAPYLIPLVYGADFEPATIFMQGLIIPMALIPIQTIIYIGNMSLEAVRPNVEMAAAVIVCFIAGYVITGFPSPTPVFVSLAIANFAGVVVGIISLRKRRVIRLREALLPTYNDLLFFVVAIKGYVRRS